MSEQVQSLLVSSGVIAAGFLLAVAFYESLSTRDVLVGRALRVTRRMTKRNSIVGVVYALSVGVGIPLLVVLWTFVLEAGLFLVGAVDRVTAVAPISVAVVGAARILTYVRAKTAHELAKAVPLSFAFILLSGGSLNLEDKLARAAEDPDLLSLTPTMIGFLVALEIGLRVVTDGSHELLAVMRRRRGIRSDLGVWATLATILRIKAREP